MAYGSTISLIYFALKETFESAYDSILNIGFVKRKLTELTFEMAASESTKKNSTHFEL